MPSDGQQVSQQSLEIKQNDKFFTRIMSKESSMANSSNRVYYGGASGAVPFMWESRPGLMDDYDHNDGHGLRSPISTLCCDVKRKAVSGCLGYHFMRNMKSAVS
ncbi:hypothetical protein NC653_031181 [Populus alba x Populus x berolinensis]|uniref:Uncharacterized protein n=1 Tax=Populus alba x Populus x berolinensis TaxID=444605 RepID=A0AAD6Q1A6_9ROSI|nr:hypothetical protein NC653_031181 [Populus alba x Populus x berolinensis]